MNFEDAFKEDREIPLHEAAHFFVGIKKFAEWTDPPDMTGTLEGQFNVPVEQVLEKLKAIIAMKFRKMVGYFTYAQSFRDHAWRAIKDEFGEHAHDEHEDAEFYVKRAVALGGPVHMEDIAAPPPSNNPLGILKMMARAEQEAIAVQRELLQLVGDENPMRVGIEEALHHDQHHLDEMWQVMTQEEHQGVELGEEPMAGMEEELPPEEEEVPQAGEAEPKEVLASMRLSALFSKTAADKSDADLKETGRQRGVANLAAEATREKGRRGERLGQVAGAVGGAAGGAALGKKYLGRHGALGGAALGMLAGGKAGKELGTEHDIHKNAASFMESATGATLPGAKFLKRFDLKKPKEKQAQGLDEKVASMRFQLALMKVAEGEPEGGASAEEAGMSSPTAGELEPSNYLNAELEGRQAQEQNESNYYREQLGQAKQEAMSMSQQAQQAQMQLEQVQQQAEQASTQIQAAAQQAVQAQDAATQQTLEAAKARIGAQEMRAKMLELVSQDPSVFGESAMGPAPGMAPPVPGAPGAPGTEPPPEGGGAPAPDAEAMAPPGPEGPAGGAPTPPAPPGGVPAAAGGVGPGGPAAPAGPPPGPDPSMAAPASQMKTGSAMAERLIGAGAGAALGAGGSLYAGSKAPEYAAKAQQMNQDKGDSFWAAARAAAAQNKATGAQLAADHPVGSALMGGLGGAVSGAMAGPSIMHQGRELGRNISDIAGR